MYTLVPICIGSINTRHDDDDDDDWTCMLDLTTKWVRSFLYGPWPSGSAPCHTHTVTRNESINRLADRPVHIYKGVVFKCYLIKLPILINGFLVFYIYISNDVCVFFFQFRTTGVRGAFRLPTLVRYFYDTGIRAISSIRDLILKSKN